MLAHFIQQNGDAFKLEESCAAFERCARRAELEPVVLATLANPAVVYCALQKDAKSQKESKGLLFRLFLQSLIRQPHLISEHSIHAIPMCIVRNPRLQFLIGLLFYLREGVYRRLRRDHKHYLAEVAVREDPTNLWYLPAFDLAATRAHRAVLRSQCLETRSLAFPLYVCHCYCYCYS